MTKTKALLVVLCGLVGAWCALSQTTKVDLRNQSKTVDFSGAPSTKPARVVTALAAFCSTGEFAFLTTAVPGQNLYLCVAQNTWAQVAGGSGGGGASQRSAVTSTPNVITMAAGTVWTPQGQNVYASAGTITANAGTDTGIFTAAYNAAGQRVCYYGLGINISNYTVSGFAGNTCTTPAPSSGLFTAATVAINAGVFATPIDFRADAFVETVSCGTNLTTVAGGGCAVDPTSGLQWTGSVNFTGATATSPVRGGNINPATCAVGELFVNTISGAALNYCIALNTWTQIH